MDLIDALDLQPHDCVAIVGGGGKSTIMYRIGREATVRGMPVVLGGTTRFTPPRQGTLPALVVLGHTDLSVQGVRDALKRTGAITVCGGHGDKGRLLPATVQQVEAIAAAKLALLVLEADGSRNRPFKAPGEHEPAIPASATVVLCVTGLDVLGTALDERTVHRPELAGAIARLAPGAALTSSAVAAVLLSSSGGRKGVPPTARWIPVLNKAEPEREASGNDLAQLLMAGGAERVVLAAAAHEPPVAAVLLSSTARRPA